MALVDGVHHLTFLTADLDRLIASTSAISTRA
jgi:hypothetical protein